MGKEVTKSRMRGKLSRSAIEDAAFALIEREGLDGFSTRKLAADLGCEAMSIYHHFPSKAHLFEALVDRLVSAIEPPPADLPWRERMRWSMESFRKMGRSQPAFAPFLMTYRMNSPTCLAWLDSVIALFHEGGFAPEQAARLFRAVGYYLTGAVLEETAGYARGPSAVTTVNEEQLRRDFPNVVAAGRFFDSACFDTTFRLGVDMILDEMDRLRGAAGQA